MAALPEDLLRMVYRLGLQHDIVSLRDRVRALGVCRAWRRGLNTALLPLPELEIGGSWEPEEDVTLCEWLIATCPAVEALSLCSTSQRMGELLPALFHAIRPEVLGSLTWYRASSAPTALPSLAVLSSIKQLILQELPCVPQWLQQLSSLQRLSYLQLYLTAAQGGQGAPVLPLPHMPSLEALDLIVPAGLTVQLQTPDAPQLRDLYVSGGGSITIGAASRQPAAQLQSLSLTTAGAAMDFAVLPALRSLTLATPRLEGADSIDAATALTALEIGQRDQVNFEVAWDEEWVCEVLRNAPPSLQAIAIYGMWTAEAAALVGRKELAALAVVTHTPDCPLPAEGAAVWAQLRVFDWWASQLDARLPQALRGATQLRALQVAFSRAMLVDLDLVASLPALRKLVMSPFGHIGIRGVDDAVVSLARRTMPHLEEVETYESFRLNLCDLVAWGLA